MKEEKAVIYEKIYKTPDGLDDLIMISDGEYLIGLHFSKNASKNMKKILKEHIPVFEETERWLDIYFSGKEPNFTPKYRIEGATPFRESVLDILRSIPYGKTLTYGDIAKSIAESRGLKRMSSQAVGGAVGCNPICLIIPCHRVIGGGGNLTGYTGGLHNKVALLKLEKIDVQELYPPKKNKK